jgi:hypothetical protein
MMAWQQKFEEWKSAYDEAVRRDAAEPEPGPDTFDGKGSHVSVLAHLGDVVKERGMEGDLDALKSLIARFRR